MPVLVTGIYAGTFRKTLRSKPHTAKWMAVTSTAMTERAALKRKVGRPCNRLSETPNLTVMPVLVTGIYAGTFRKTLRSKPHTAKWMAVTSTAMTERAALKKKLGRPCNRLSETPNLTVMPVLVTGIYAGTFRKTLRSKPHTAKWMAVTSTAMTERAALKRKVGRPCNRLSETPNLTAMPVLVTGIHAGTFRKTLRSKPHTATWMAVTSTAMTERAALKRKVGRPCNRLSETPNLTAMPVLVTGIHAGTFRKTLRSKPHTATWMAVTSTAMTERAALKRKLGRPCNRLLESPNPTVMPVLVTGIHAGTFRKTLRSKPHTATWMAVTSTATTERAALKRKLGRPCNRLLESPNPTVMPVLVTGIHAGTFRKTLRSKPHTATWMAVTSTATTERAALKRKLGRPCNRLLESPNPTVMPVLVTGIYAGTFRKTLRSKPHAATWMAVTSTAMTERATLKRKLGRPCNRLSETPNPTVMPVLVTGIHAGTFRKTLRSKPHTATWMAVTSTAMTEPAALKRKLGRPCNRLSETPNLTVMPVLVTGIHAGTFRKTLRS